MSPEEQFDEIIQRALSEAASVRPATEAEYRDAIQGWIGEIQSAVTAADECMDHEAEEDEL